MVAINPLREYPRCECRFHIRKLVRNIAETKHSREAFVETVVE
jgi:hypothetical protein